MQSLDLSKLLAGQDNRLWLELLRARSLSMGVYRLKAGQVDTQRPHTEDEVYFVLGGKGSFRTGAEQLQVGPGTLIFMERSVEHHFCEVTEDLTLLVFFAPPEGSLKADQASVSGGAGELTVE